MRVFGKVIRLGGFAAMESFFDSGKLSSPGESRDTGLAGCVHGPLRRRIKILFIIDSLRHVGGAEHQLVQLIEKSDKDIFDISICILDSRYTELLGRIKKASVRLYIIPQGGFFDPLCLLRLCMLVRSLCPDIINTFLYTAEFYGRLAGVFQGTNIIINSVRNIDLWKKRRNILADRFLEKHTEHFTANSRAVKDYLLRKYNIREDKISVIYNGVELNRFNPSAENHGLKFGDECFSASGGGFDSIEQYSEGDFDRKQKGIPGFSPVGSTKDGFNSERLLDIVPARKIILNIARFSPQKDHNTLINAAKIILQKRQDVFFILIGRGESKSAARTCIEKAGMKNFFLLLDETRKPQYFYGIAYLSLLTSLYEGFNNFLLESMSCGLPVVATSVGGNPELVIDGKTGFLVPSENPGEAAEKVLFLLDNPDTARQFAVEARKSVEEKFTIEKMTDKYRDLYMGLYCKSKHAA